MEKQSPLTKPDRRKNSAVVAVEIAAAVVASVVGAVAAAAVVEIAAAVADTNILKQTAEGSIDKTLLQFAYFPDSMYSTIFSAMVLTTHSNSVSSLSNNVMRKPGSGVKKEVSGTTQIPVAPKR